MSQHFAAAYPRKNFFIQMFTKDISLEDCLLDLIDNSIDGLIRSQSLKLSAISRTVFSRGAHPKPRIRDLPRVTVEYSDQSIRIEDNCGGIDWDYARTEAFNFGHAADWKRGYLGAYGVGLKRALFKLGDRFHIDSRTVANGFTCELNVSEWVQRDNAIEDWRLPLVRQRRAPSAKSAGTSIKVTRLHEEVKMRLNSGTIDEAVYRSISQTYAFFLRTYVRVVVNGREVEPFDVPIAKPTGGTPSFEEFVQDKVKVRIFATIAGADATGRLSQELAGWYVVCNGRVVLAADKSEVSGWGVGPTPTYQPKHRGFVGLVFFEAQDPRLLPWTTTKRALNGESAVYLRVRGRMASAARPVISFLNKQYPSEADDEPAERRIMRNGKRTSVGALVSRGGSSFSAPSARRKTAKTTTRVQYDAENSELEKVRKHLRKPRMGANRIGEHTFQYFLEEEGLA